MQNSWDAIRKAWRTAPRSKNKPSKQAKWIWTQSGWINAASPAGKRKARYRAGLRRAMEQKYRDWLEQHKITTGKPASKAIKRQTRRRLLAELEGEKARARAKIQETPIPRQPQYSPRYREYIVSPAWEAKRQEVFAKRGRKCERCGTAKGPIQVHHNTYERLGAEWLEDLTILCKPCHEDFHGRTF